VAADLLLCFPTDVEGERLRLRAGGRAVLAKLGVGPVNAAHRVTAAILHWKPRAIVLCGVGGAYPGAGLAVGDVVCAESECYGDLGADSPQGFLDMEALGFPTVEAPAPLYNVFPMQIHPVARRARFVTVSTCTGREEAARALAARTGGAVESMEGAAVAHVAHLHAIPVGEVRGISNLVGDRDRARWRVREAAAAAQEALIAWLDAR
jgi:futalosine hydrolase